MDIDLTMVAALTPLVLALVELGKRAGLPNRWAGIVAAVCRSWRVHARLPCRFARPARQR